MIELIKLVRQISFAALLLPTTAEADIIAHYQTIDGSVAITGLSSEELSHLNDAPASVTLQVSSLSDQSGMLASISRDDEKLLITPRFPLRKGQSYNIALHLLDGNLLQTSFDVAGEKKPALAVTGILPDMAHVPANTLRFYLSFSQAMATGQVRESIRLIGPDGREIANPFLNLGTELWDHQQRRLTVLFDPGRIKQGVGPNRDHGAPLSDQQVYQLIVDGQMKSAAGQTLGENFVQKINVVAPLREKITPERWTMNQPTASTQEPLSVVFDRPMDDGASRRFLRVIDHAGSLVLGQIKTEGQAWHFTPSHPWRQGGHQLIIDPALEDVAGNTIRSSFDAEAGTIGKRTAPARLTFSLR